MQRKRHSGKKGGANFWNEEYANAGHLALSENASEDMLKFLRWLEREDGKRLLNPTMSALDAGCGNGRNLVYLGKTYGMHGMGYDISGEAIKQAKGLGAGLPLEFTVASLSEAIPLPDASQALVLDLMSSHVLSNEERDRFYAEIARVLRDDGWFVLKTFLLDEDKNARRLLKEHPGKEAGAYIHPVIGVAEYVFSEEELLSRIQVYFTVHKVYKSHGHLRTRSAAKRRSVTLYLQKK